MWLALTAMNLGKRQKKLEKEKAKQRHTKLRAPSKIYNNSGYEAWKKHTGKH